MTLKRLLAVAPVVLVVGCQSPLEPSGSSAGISRSTRPAVEPEGTTGGGRLLVSGSIETAFTFNAVQTGTGGAEGRLHYALTLEGLPAEFYGRVTCFAVNPVTHRAWVGGVVTENLSQHPSYTTPRTQVGRDIWFRVVDNGEGSDAVPDRSTFVGFEGDRGILTSAEYCARKLWVDGDVGTHPVTAGNIQVRP
jgi:hypothetical protein